MWLLALSPLQSFTSGTNLPVPIISLLIGIALLFFGRRLFWLFVAAIGFAIGLQLAPYLMQDPPPWLSLAISKLRSRTSPTTPTTSRGPL